LQAAEQLARGLVSAECFPAVASQSDRGDGHGPFLLFSLLM
jgi:hypothetical protein